MSSPDEPASQRRLVVRMAVATLGIVFGDIGTSPLYALRECFGEHGVAPSPANVLGVLSLIIWSAFAAASNACALTSVASLASAAG